MASSKSSNRSGLSCFRVVSVNPLLIWTLSWVSVEFMWLMLKNMQGVVGLSWQWFLLWQRQRVLCLMTTYTLFTKQPRKTLSKNCSSQTNSGLLCLTASPRSVSVILECNLKNQQQGSQWNSYHLYLYLMSSLIKRFFLFIQPAISTRVTTTFGLRFVWGLMPIFMIFVPYYAYLEELQTKQEFLTICDIQYVGVEPLEERRKVEEDPKLVEADRQQKMAMVKKMMGNLL